MLLLMTKIRRRGRDFCSKMAICYNRFQDATKLTILKNLHSHFIAS